jgi:hypothetical protein
VGNAPSRPSDGKEAERGVRADAASAPVSAKTTALLKIDAEPLPVRAEELYVGVGLLLRRDFPGRDCLLE